MTRKYTSHTSGLFLLELILAILFFSIASAVCVQLFVKSHLLSSQAEILSVAVNECSDAAQIILSSDTQSEVLERLSIAYSDAVWTSDETNEFQLETYYENDHQMIVSCIISGTPSKNSAISAKIVFLKPEESEPIYKLEISHLLSDSIGN